MCVYAFWFFYLLFPSFSPFQPSNVCRYVFLNIFSFGTRLLHLKSCIFLVWNGGTSLEEIITFKFMLSFLHPSVHSLSASFLSFVFSVWISVSWSLFSNTIFIFCRVLSLNLLSCSSYVVDLCSSLSWSSMPFTKLGKKMLMEQ